MKKYIIYGLITAVIIAGIVWKNCNDDKKIIAQAKKIEKTKLENVQLIKEIEAKKEVIKKANEKISVAEEGQRTAKLSLMETEKRMDEEITGIEKLRKVGAKNLIISVEQWESALLEVEKYKEQCQNNDIKWRELSQELKLKIEEQDTLIKLQDKLIKNLQKQNLDLNILSLRLQNKINKKFFIGITLGPGVHPDGFSYLQMTVGATMKLNRKTILPSFKKLLLGG